jgi:hypothetical protein
MIIGQEQNFARIGTILASITVPKVPDFSITQVHFAGHVTSGTSDIQCVVRVGSSSQDGIGRHLISTESTHQLVTCIKSKQMK